MEFRTTFTISPACDKISYSTPAMFIGSCFADAVSSKFKAGRMPVMSNPSGTVYNPVSVINTLESIIGSREFTEKDLFNFNGFWLSFDHYTDFSSDNSKTVLERINSRREEAHDFLSKASYLFITFGTARIYRRKETGRIVSNCHKIPDAYFTRELLTVDDIVNRWNDELDRLKSFNPELKIIFTISPVRHWKDNPHGNQVSKSTLFLAVEQLLNHPGNPAYFPAYELVMDDLRDYRFYAGDMLHLSDTAIDYIWNAFTNCYFDSETAETWNEAEKITRAVSHRLRSDSGESVRLFAATMLKKIDSLCSIKPFLNLSAEREYFLQICGS